VTSITNCRSTSACLFASVWRHLVNVITTLYYVAISSSRSVVLRAFSVLCMYSTFGHHPHSLGYLCAKFCFFHCL